MERNRAPFSTTSGGAATRQGRLRGHHRRNGARHTSSSRTTSGQRSASRHWFQRRRIASAHVGSATGPSLRARATPPGNESPPTISGTAAGGSDADRLSGHVVGEPADQLTRTNGGAAIVLVGTADTSRGDGGDVCGERRPTSGSTLRVRCDGVNGATVSVDSDAVEADGPVSLLAIGDVDRSPVDRRWFKNGSVRQRATTRRSPASSRATQAPLCRSTAWRQYLEVSAIRSGHRPASRSRSLSSRRRCRRTRRSGRRRSGLRGWWLNTDVNGSLRMFVGNGSSWQWSTAGPVLTPGDALTISSATYDGTSARLYVNGALASTGPAATMAPNSHDVADARSASSTGLGSTGRA